MEAKMTAEKMFATYEDRLVRRDVSIYALREYRQTTKRFAAWLRAKGMQVEDVRRPDIEDFFAESGWSPSTQRARVTWLKAPWTYALDQEMVERSPFNGMRLELKKVPSREPRIIPIEDLRAIKAGIRDHRANALFHILAYTGFRISEIFSLTWNDVSFAHQTLHVIGKGNKERTIPLHPAAQEALRAYGQFGEGSIFLFPGRNGGRMSPSGADHAVGKLCDPFDWTAHDFRRTLATSLGHNGVERPVIRQILGHTEQDITFVYMRYTQKTMFEAILMAYREEML